MKRRAFQRCRNPSAFDITHMASIFIINPDGTETEQSLPAKTVRIGRAAENDIVVDDPSISAFHCEIRVGDGFFQFKDMGSTNGIRVNGERLPEAMLCDGDLIRFGKVRARFVWGDSPPPKEALPAQLAPKDAVKAEAEAPLEDVDMNSPAQEKRKLRGEMPPGFGAPKKKSNPEKSMFVVISVLILLLAAAALVFAVISMR